MKKSQSATNAPVPQEPAGRSIESFTAAAGISRALFYSLPPESRPAHFKVGRRVIVTETPAAWVARMAAQGGTETLRPKAAVAAAA